MTSPNRECRNPVMPLRAASSARVALLGLGAFAVGTDAYIVAGLLPDMARGLHVTQPAAGQSVTVFAVWYAVLSPVLATMTGRLPRHRLLAGGLAVLVVANLVVAAAGGLGMALAGRTIAAMGAALYIPTAITLSASLVPAAQRGRALSVVPGGLTLATVVGVPLGTLADQHLGWRVVLVLVSALAGVVLLGVVGTVRAVPVEPSVGLRVRLRVLRRTVVLAVLAVSVLGVSGSYAVYTYASSVLQQGLGLPGTQIGLILAAYGLGAVIGNLASGYGIDRVGSRLVLVAAFSAQAVALAALWAVGTFDAGDTIAAGLAAALWGAGTWSQAPAQQYRLIMLAPDAARIVISLNGSAIYLGIGIAGAIGGLTLDLLGVRSLPLLAAAVAAVALLMILVPRSSLVNASRSAARTTE